MNDEIWKIFDSLVIEENPPVDNQCIKCKENGIVIEDSSNGYFVCIICGLTKKDNIIDSGPEIYYQDSNKVNPSRHGIFDELYPNSSLTTVISGSSKLSKINQWNTMPYNERTLWQVSEHIKRQCSMYNVNNQVIKNAILLFKKIDEKKKNNGKKEIHRGRVRDGIISACLYYSFKKENIERTPLEISKIMSVDIIDITRGCKLFLDILKDEKFETPQPSDFLFRYGNSLNLQYKIISDMNKILKEVINLNILSRNTPISIVAGTIYFCCIVFNINISKKTVSSVCNVSDVTISKTFKKLQEHKSLLV